MSIFDIKELCYGGDYNPEQWIDYEGIWDEDIRLMKKAHINCVSLGIFSWSMLEKEEGVFDFSWMDAIIDRLYENGIYVILATPSGARPPWLAQKYPEVLRTNSIRQKHLYGRRHNHCLTSPVYREKTAMIDEKLSQRYGRHPAVIMWHISNEMSGECHCQRCQERFREWLRDKYRGSLDELNRAWWTTFWSHRYTDWSQINAPSPIGDTGTHGHYLDWMRFLSDMHTDFMNNEINAVRKHSDLPVTTNFMEIEGLNYRRIGEDVDIVSWDCYPRWHNNTETALGTAMWTSFHHDLMRSIKQKPFLMMESTPSLVNWHDTNKLKAPGLNILSCMQAIAHGSDGALYFQMRKSRGASEKFHGAVIDHEGSENTRVFKEAAEAGRIISQHPEIKGSYTKSDVAVIYDYENSWAIDEMCGLKQYKGYKDTCIAHYSVLRKQGINVDIIGRKDDFSRYKVICAPMLYMLPKETADKIREFVGNGGTYIATYLTSYADENDICHLGGFPGNLKDVFGIWNEEIDSIYEKNGIVTGDKVYDVTDYCELIHPDEDTEVLGVYKADFYAGHPAVTRHAYGEGETYYIAARTGQDYLKELYSKILDDNGIIPLAESFDSETVSVVRRGDYVFFMNFSDKESKAEYNGEKITLKPYECVIR